MAWLRRRKQQLNDPAWNVRPGDVLAMDRPDGQVVRIAVREVIPAERPFPFKRVVVEVVGDDNTRRAVDLREGNDSWMPVGGPADTTSIADLPPMLSAVGGDLGSAITPGLAIVSASGPPEPTDDDVASAGLVRVATLESAARVDGYALTLMSWQELVDRLGRASLA